MNHEEIVKELFSRIKKENVTNVDLGFKQLQEAAKKFLIEIERINKKEEGKNFIENTIKMKIKNFNTEEIYNYDSLYTFKRKMYDNLIDKNYKNEMITAIMNFQKALNIFLEREIILTIVDEKGEILFYDEEKEEEIYKKGSLNKNRISLSKAHQIDPLKTLNQIIEEIKEEKNKEDVINHVNNIKNIYITTLKRAEETSEYKYKKKSIHFTYWINRNNIREYGYLRDLGVVSEAYATALFDESGKINQGAESLEDKIFNFYTLYILQVDSRAGIVAGDTAKSILQEVQLAVKKKFVASSQSFGPLVTTALMLVNTSQEDFTKESLSHFFEEMEKNNKSKEFLNKKLLNSLTDKAKKEFRSLKRQLEKENIKIEIYKF